MKTLMVLSAIPASGKSTWARNYQMTHENVKIVSSDKIREEVTGCLTDYSKQALVWETFDKRIKEYAKEDNVTVLLDALNDLNSLRVRYVENNPEFDKYVLVIFKYNPEHSLHYNSLRTDDSRVPDEAMKNLIAKFEQPDKETLSHFDEAYLVSWKDNILEKIEL